MRMTLTAVIQKACPHRPSKKDQLKFLNRRLERQPQLQTKEPGMAQERIMLLPLFLNLQTIQDAAHGKVGTSSQKEMVQQGLWKMNLASLEI